jgi:hypothetical protein
LLNRVGLEERSIYTLESGAPYRGQAQMLADLRELHALPGGNLSMGAYANQTDYYTTYEGGFGFYSESLGIERAIEDGGRTIEALQRTGVAPDVELYLGAGGNPIMSVGGLNQSLYQSFWGDMDAAERRQTWEALAADWIEQLFPWASTSWEHDLPRLLAGSAFLGEISGPSDGLVFTASALDETGVSVAGAQVMEARLFEALNHAEIIAAGQLAADFYGDTELAGPLIDAELAAKYAEPENQPVEWIIDVLRGPVPEQGGAEAGSEAGSEAGVMGGGEAGAQAGSEAGTEAGAEPIGGATSAGVEAGVEAGAPSPQGGQVSAGVEAQGGSAESFDPTQDTTSGGRFDGSGCAQPLNGSRSLPLPALLFFALFGVLTRRTSHTTHNTHNPHTTPQAR